MKNQLKKTSKSKTPRSFLEPPGQIWLSIELRLIVLGKKPPPHRPSCSHTSREQRQIGEARLEQGEEKPSSPYPPSVRPGFATAKIHSIHRRLGGLPEISPRYSSSIIMGRNSNYFACLSGNRNISCLLNDSSSGDYFHIKPRSVCCHFKKN